VTDDLVSRETPPAPEVARGVFSSTLPTAARYAELLATDGVLRGLIGPREVPRLWERHLLNCALLGRGIAQEADVCDVGTGAGLPGLVLALSRPDLQVTLVEPLLRRSTFLDEAVERLELANVEVIRARAEELHGLRRFAVVTSRAVAPLPRLLAWSMPLVRRDGVLLAMKGAGAADELRAAARDVRAHGGTYPTVESYGAGLVEPPTRVVRVVAGESPRRRPGSGRRATVKRGRRRTRENHRPRPGDPPSDQPSSRPSSRPSDGRGDGAQ